MKPLLFLGASIFCTARLFAQAYIGETEVRSTKQAAAAIRLPYDNDPVEDGLKQYMMTKGFKSTGVSGFILFRSVPLDGMDTTLNDLYFKAVASRKEKGMTVLSLIPAKRNEEFMARTLADSAKLEKARLFLDSLAPFMTSYNTRLQLSSQQEVLGKAQKKMNSLRSDSSDLQRKIRNLQSDLDQNQKDQVKAASDLQTSINADDDTKKKYQKRVNKYLDEEASLQKKLRRAKQDLEDNKNEMEKQQEEINKQQQGLNAVRTRNGTI
ncbi:MAG TPA: hypothetical protein VGN00_17985 [Puia sp.]|jgi:uncharacterized phage infection (PIP) family protein YhgE